MQEIFTPDQYMKRMTQIQKMHDSKRQERMDEAIKIANEEIGKWAGYKARKVRVLCENEYDAFIDSGKFTFLSKEEFYQLGEHLSSAGWRVCRTILGDFELYLPRPPKPMPGVLKFLLSLVGWQHK